MKSWLKKIIAQCDVCGHILGEHDPLSHRYHDVHQEIEKLEKKLLVDASVNRLFGEEYSSPYFQPNDQV